VLARERETCRTTPHPRPLPATRFGAWREGEEAGRLRVTTTRLRRPLTEVVTTPAHAGQDGAAETGWRAWLDELDETGRWGASKTRHRRDADRDLGAAGGKTAAAELGAKEPARDRIDVAGPQPRPISICFAWLEGRGEKPENLDPAPFRPVMAGRTPIEHTDFLRVLMLPISSRSGNGTASACRR